MVRAIIFDCFGVIVGKGFENTYRAAGGDPQKDRSFINDMLTRANLGLINDLDFRTGMAQKIGLSLDDWRRAVLAAEQPDTELLNYIKKLRKNHKTAILSNANHGSLDRKIGAEWLEACFDVVVVSADEGMIKPDPQIYHLTAERLGVEPSDCVFIDDKQVQTEGAKNIGMQAIVYKDLAQLKLDLAPLVKLD